MLCPHCKHDADLTWKRYWSAPLGRHRCPACLGQFQLEYSIGQFASRFGIALPGALIAVAIHTRTQGWLIPALFYLAYSCLIGLPLDRVIDDRWRKAIPHFPSDTA